MVTSEQALKYFTGKKDKIFGTMGISVLVFAGSIYGSAYGLVTISVIVFAVCWYLLSLYPKDEDIDNSFVELKDKNTPLALKRLGIEKEDTIRPPLVIFGVGSYDYSKEGDDNIWRYNPMKVEIIHFGKNQLFVNGVSLDLIDQESYTGNTNEFFYKDISAVSIQDDADEKRFLIKVHGETELDVAIFKDDESIKIAEEAVASIRKIMRERKQ